MKPKNEIELLECRIRGLSRLVMALALLLVKKKLATAHEVRRYVLISGLHAEATVNPHEAAPMAAFLKLWNAFEDDGPDPLSAMAARVLMQLAAGTQAQAMGSFLSYASAPEIAEELSQALKKTVSTAGRPRRAADASAAGAAARPTRPRRAPKPRGGGA
ncbi:MAG: hypothetical protein ACT4QA_17530 [Panacagrimonas sp.]